MAITGTTETKKTNKEEANYTSEEQEIIRLNSELKDLKDLYDNVVKENQGLIKERNELRAEVLEIKTILDDKNEEVDNVRKEFVDDFNVFEKDIAILEAIVDELRGQKDNLNDIITNLINK